MTANLKYSLLLTVLLAVAFSGTAQTNASVFINFEPEFRRLINHDAINKEQKGLLAADGKSDNEFIASANDNINFLLTRILVKGGAIDELRYTIETDSVFDHRLKVNYLTGLSNDCAIYVKTGKTEK